MHVFQTAGVPPRRGNTILANIGWTKNNRLALTRSVRANSSCISRSLRVQRGKAAIQLAGTAANQRMAVQRQMRGPDSRRPTRLGKDTSREQPNKDPPKDKFR